MSKIIKSHDHTLVTPFDFRAIEEGAGEVRFGKGGLNRSGGVRGKANSGGPSRMDPLEELEQTIRNRLLEVERRAQELEKEAYEKGYAQGEKDGFEYGEKSIRIVKEQLERLLGGLQSIPERVFKDYRDWLIATSLAVARHVVGLELTTRPEALLQTIDALLAEAEEHQSLTLYLNPKDLDLLKKNTDLAQWSGESERTFLLRTDNGLERCGCRLESDIQLLDATIETQFSMIEKALRGDEAT